jgi:hypothetical protein
MILTQKLFGRLNRVFRKDGAPILAFRLTYAGADMTWQVRDQTLTTTVTGGAGANLSVDLTAYTLSGLAAFLAAQTGYSVLNLNSTDFAGLGAVVLIDATGDINTSNGDHFYGATGLTYAILDAAAVPLRAAKLAISAMLLEMSTTTADGEWLDFLGGFYKVPRQPAEADVTYSLRIPATVLQIKANNKALEIAIKAATGQAATVTDVVVAGDNLHKYGLFDIQVGYDPTTFAVFVRALIEPMRDAGTHLRNVTLAAGGVSDDAEAVTDSAAGLVSTFPLWNGVWNFDGRTNFAPSITADSMLG